MTISFSMIGKIAPIKATDKFLPYEERVSKSGWKMRTLNFNCMNGNNRHLLRVNGMCKKDESNLIYCPAAKNDEGKFESLRIPFKERTTHPDLEKVAPFKWLVIDLEKPGRRTLLKNADEAIKNGSVVTDEQLEEMGLKDVSEVKDAYEKSLKKRKQYISEWDFAADLNKILASEKYAGKKFLIRGVHEFRYNEDLSKVYDNFVPQRIYLAREDAEEQATEQVTCYFKKDGLVDNTEVQGRYYVQSKIFVYDSRFKEDYAGQIPADYMFSIKSPEIIEDEKQKRRNEKFIKIFTVEDNDKWYETNIVCDLINGSETSSITYDDLDDDLKDDIDLGIVTLNDVIEEMGGVTYGERIQENQLKAFSRKSAKTRIEETAYDDDNFKLPTEKNQSEDDDLDIDFDDDEEDIFL